MPISLKNTSIKSGQSRKRRIGILLAAIICLALSLFTYFSSTDAHAVIWTQIAENITRIKDTFTEIKEFSDSTKDLAYVKNQNKEIQESIMVLGDTETVVNDLYKKATAAANKQDAKELDEIKTKIAKTNAYGTLADAIVYGRYTYTPKQWDKTSVEQMADDLLNAGYDEEYVEQWREDLTDTRITKSLADYAMDITCAVGIVFILIYALIHMIQMVTKEQGSLEGWLRLFVLTTLGFFAVIFAGDILHVIERFGLRIYTEISGAMLTADITDQYNNTMTSTSEIGGLSSLIIWLVMWVTYIAMVAGAYGLLFELCIRRMFMPIAVASIAHDGIVGVRGAGTKYLLGYFGMYLRMIAFSAVVVLYTIAIHYIEKGVAQTGQWEPIAIIAVRMAATSIIGSSSNVIREVFQ